VILSVLLGMGLLLCAGLNRRGVVNERVIR